MGAFGNGLVGGMNQMGGLQLQQQLAKQMQGQNQEALGKQIVAGSQQAPGFEMPQNMMPQLQMQDLRSRILSSMLQGGRF
jgi:hypothetical protein